VLRQVVLLLLPALHVSDTHARPCSMRCFFLGCQSLSSSLEMSYGFRKMSARGRDNACHRCTSSSDRCCFRSCVST
jgi:hypothetical protein